MNGHPIDVQQPCLDGIVDLIVECRKGSLAAAMGAPGRSSASGQLDMAIWKRIVADLATHRSDTPVRLVFFGAANQISGYRLYYMLRHAKRADLRQVTLHSDGLFWIDEATEWLIDSGVDRIILSPTGDSMRAVLTERVRDLEAGILAAGGGPIVQIDGIGTHAAEPLRRTARLRAIDWRGQIVW